VFQDFANPLTRFTMQDYPQMTGSGMSEVFHAYKMNLGVPSSLVSPTIRVRGTIYYTDELLQKLDGTYFIPERYFCRVDEQRAMSSNGQRIAQASDMDSELMAVGHDVLWTEVYQYHFCLILLFNLS